MIKLKRKYAECKEKKIRKKNTNWQSKQQEKGRDKLEMKDYVTKIFYIDHICDKAECNQACNLFFIKHTFNSLLFRQQAHILVGEEVQAVNWMGGVLEAE